MTRVTCGVLLVGLLLPCSPAAPAPRARLTEQMLTSQVWELTYMPPAGEDTLPSRGLAEFTPNGLFVTELSGRPYVERWELNPAKPDQVFVYTHRRQTTPCYVLTYCPRRGTLSGPAPSWILTLKRRP